MVEEPLDFRDGRLTRGRDETACRNRRFGDCDQRFSMVHEVKVHWSDQCVTHLGSLASRSKSTAANPLARRANVPSSRPYVAVSVAPNKNEPSSSATWAASRRPDA